MIKVGIIGGAGYTAGELIRILIHHPMAQLRFVHSNSNAGHKLSEVHRDLDGETDIIFSDKIDNEIDVLFFCMGHGKSKEFLNKVELSKNIKIIDLSHDFRLSNKASQGIRNFVYGLPELNKAAIQTASNVANPGCFATAIQLALLPLAKEKLLKNEVHIHAITGSTGAGQSPTPTTHYSWRNNNISVYKAFQHQHLGEIGESLTQLQTYNGFGLNFIPVRGNFTRGIFATAYTKCDSSLEEVKKAYITYYDNDPFTHVSDQPIYLKQAVNTNKCLLHLDKQGDKILITSVIDNLIKGASGQAIQNMNLMFGLEENTGLKLKSTLF